MQQISGTFYHDDTPTDVIRVLEHVRLNKSRIRLRYGDRETGRDWLEEHDVEGTLSRSMGPVKVPILIHNSRSIGGPQLLDHCIVRIIDMATKRVLYSHPNYHRGEFMIQGNEVLVDGQIHARFADNSRAARWIKKMSL